MADIPISSVTGKPMARDVRPVVLSYKGHSVTVQMPGWYCQDSDEAIHTGEDMKVSDVALRCLKKMSDIVERLRKAGDSWPEEVITGDLQLYLDAADKILDLEAEIERLKERNRELQLILTNHRLRGCNVNWNSVALLNEPYAANVKEVN